MKRLVILTPYLDNTIGGIGVYAKNYYSRIKHHFDTYVLTPDIKKSTRNIIKVSLNFFEIYHHLRRLKPDIIDNSGGWYQPLFPCVI